MSNNIPITEVPKSEQQHMLLLFFPIKAGGGAKAAEGARQVLSSQSAASPTAPKKSAGKPMALPADPRGLTGVHFFMIYHLSSAHPPPPMIVPTFQAAKGKDLLVVQSIYDADFKPYITAFTNNLAIAFGLDQVLQSMDESGLYPDWKTAKNSAIQIVKNAKPDGTGGVNAHPTEFIELLMRYNFGDPLIAGSSTPPSNTFTKPGPKYLLAATFPGLTVGKILQNYPNANALWPLPPPAIKFD